MSADSEAPALRLLGAVLCASASLLLLFSSSHLYATGGGRSGAAMLLVVGLGLLLAAVKSFRRR